MKIVVLGDTIVSGNIFGIQRYAYEILKEVDAMNPVWDIVLLVPAYAEISIRFKNIKIEKFGMLKNGFLWRQLCFPKYLKKHHAIGVDLTLGLPYFKCDIVALHDCTYENYSGNFVTKKEKLKRYSYLFRARHLVKTCKKIITVSNNSKKELMEYYHIPEGKITVIYNSWQHYAAIECDETIFSAVNLDKNEKYFFSLGSGLKHKNLLWIVNAAIQNPQYKFVVTGSDKFSGYIKQLGFERIENIIYTGYISDGQVKALMTYCRALIHPAFCEGFGIPPLEALSCGTDIIISDKSCLPEIYKDSAIYIDPNGYEPINMDCILEKKVPDDARFRILNTYSWKDSARGFLEIIEGLV